MILEQHYLACLAQASYLVGDEESGVAAVVDPRRDVGVYLEAAGERGLRIEHVLLTHFHADFLAGHLELRERCGARIWLGARAQAEFDFAPMREGSSLELGPRVRLEFLETPGHTPEGVCIAVFDGAQSPTEPRAVLTGDTLFLGDVGRPDLMASAGISAEELAGQLYDSLHDKLLKLPEDTLVYPGHGAGSMCGKNLSDETVSTLGVQRRTNYALQDMSRQDFVRTLTTNLPQAPAYFGYDAALNRRERATLDPALPGLAELSLEEVLARRNAGAQVLDARDPEEFARGHLGGSISVGLDGKFAMWCGSVLDPGRAIVLIAPAGREREAALRLGRIGFDRVDGWLSGGAAALAGQPELLRSLQRIDPPELAQRLEGPEPPLVVDVRQPGEHAAGHLPDSRNVPLRALLERLDQVPREREVALHCQGGYRSVIAASLLMAAGRERLVDLRGGFEAWSATRGAARTS